MCVPSRNLFAMTIIGALCMTLPATAAAQGTYFVDDDARSDPGPGDPAVSDPLEDGTPQHPFDLIQEALDLCQPGDTVRILAGTYPEYLQVPSSGCHIQGEGESEVSVYMIEADLEGTPTDPARLEIEGLSFLLSVIVRDVSGPCPPSTAGVRVDLRHLQSNGGYIQGFFNGQAELVVDTARLQYGLIWLRALGCGSFDAIVSNIDARNTVVENSVAPEAESRLLVADSLLAGVDYQGGGDLLVRSVRFTEGGIRVFGGDRPDPGFLEVEDSIFEYDGLHVVWRGSGFIPVSQETVIKDSFFLSSGYGGFQGGVVYDVSSGCRSTGRPGPNDFSLHVTRSGFSGRGIEVEAERCARATLGNSTQVRVQNSIFRGTGVRVHHAYEAPQPGQAILGALRGRTEVVNNTFHFSYTAVEVVTGPHAPSLDTLTTIISNNIIAEGADGIRIDGLDDQMLFVRSNDLFGNSGMDYAGDLPDLTGQDGNIAQDPLFYFGGGSTSKNLGDYAIRMESPCVDAGHDGQATPPADFAGTSRP